MRRHSTCSRMDSFRSVSHSQNLAVFIHALGVFVYVAPVSSNTLWFLNGLGFLALPTKRRGNFLLPSALVPTHTVTRTLLCFLPFSFLSVVSVPRGFRR